MPKFKLKKTLYIGLGGTGVTTLLKIKKNFIDNYGEVPPMIGFLAIDTNASVANERITDKNGNEVRLNSNELLVITVNGASQVYTRNSDRFGWVPEKNIGALSLITGLGAGQVRSNGRFIAYYNQLNVKNHVQFAVNAISHPLPVDSKYEVDYHRDAINLWINVIGSVAGGTGSGTLIDVMTLVKRAVEQIGERDSARIYPWILLPEVFRAEHTGPSMKNVLYNAYGALRELDYLSHYIPGTPAINFGYDRITEKLFDYAYIINNTNKDGATFSRISDLTDAIALCAFLPANNMGDAVTGPFDNIIVNQQASVYNILTKRAWAASAGSAELIYDRKAVANATGYNLITLLCNSMLHSERNGVADANAFFDNPDVRIRENEGHDDVIDTYLAPMPDYTITITEFTTENDIVRYISDVSSENSNEISNRLQSKFNELKNRAKTGLENYLKAIMKRPQGKVDAALKFIGASKEIVAKCVQEMDEEIAEFSQIHEPSWNDELPGIYNSGFAALLYGKINKDAVANLEQTAANFAKVKREILRRRWAIRFYDALNQMLADEEQKLNSLKSYLKTIALNYTSAFVREQRAISNSKFQIYLHEEDIRNISAQGLGETEKNNFVDFLGEGGAYKWLGMSQQSVEESLLDFTSSTEVVQNVWNKDIDTVLRSMDPETVKRYINHLKVMASPLWTYDPRGYNSEDLDMDTFFVVGVENASTSVLVENSEFSMLFQTGVNKPTFASTNSPDRVSILMVEDLLPIYAVNNFLAYANDHELKSRSTTGISNFIDSTLNNRIESENFTLLPKQQEDNTLLYWVYGFVFGYIHFDENAAQYWVESREHGDILDRYRFNLGSHRDVAFNTFKSEDIASELKRRLETRRRNEGADAFDSVIRRIKDEGSYYESHSHLSNWERDNIRQPNFVSIRELIKNESKIMSD